MMSHEQFDALVKRLEVDATRSAGAYRWRVLLLALLGYAYVFFVLALLLGLIAALVALLVSLRRGFGGVIQLIIGLLALGFMIARSLWVRLDEPAGFELTPQTAPALFAEIEGVRRAMNGPRVHKVVMDSDFNAGIVQHARLGLFGWHKNILIIGLPLMQALAPDQFRAVLAHEFGHLSGAHGKTGAWIYRMRQTWSQIMESLEREQHWGTFIFSRFFRWYAPFFNAYSFVLARQQEYEADRWAASVVGARQTGDALKTLKLGDAFLRERFWPHVYKQADERPDPPASPYADLQRAFVAGYEREPANQWLARSLQQQTDSLDTHPALRERLEALGQTTELPEPVAESAATALLEPALETLRRQVDQTWQANIREAWHGRYAEMQAKRARLAELEAKAGRETLSPDEEWQYADLTEDVRGAELALPMFQRIAADLPEHAGAHFAVGRILLQQGYGTGIEAIERAIGLSDDAILPGCELIVKFLVANGREAEAQAYWERGVAKARLEQAAEEERSRLRFSDTYFPHGLSDAQVADLRRQLAAYPEVAQAYVACKQVVHKPEKPLYALGIVARRKVWYLARKPKDDQELSMRLAKEIQFPGECFVVVLNDQNAKLRKILRRIDGARIDGASAPVQTPSHAP